MFVTAEAANAQAAAWKAVKQFHAQLAVVVEGVHVAVLDRPRASVHAYRAAVRQHRLHAVAADRDAGCTGRIDVLLAQGVLAEAQLAPAGLQDHRAALAAGQLDLLVEGQFDLVGIQGRFVVP